MDNSVSNAIFKFESYKVTEASIKLTGNKIKDSIDIEINPDGELVRDKKRFILTLNVNMSDDKNIDLSIKIMGNFTYETENMEELIPFISMNAPAILFPYIRAYISNITALGGIQPIIIPTLNLTNVGKALVKKMVW